MNENDIIFSNTQGKGEILRTLLAFEEDKAKGFKKKKYEYADKLLHHQKSDLETSKSDIEFYIDSARTLATVLSLIGTFLTMCTFLFFSASSSPRVNLATTFFLLIGASIFHGVSKKVAWLHVIKIAIAKNSEIENTNSSDVQKSSIVKEESLHFLNQATQLGEIESVKKETKSMAEVLAEIRSRSRLDPTKFGLIDSTDLIRMDRNR